MADLYDLIERVQVTLASSRSPGKEQLHELHGELTEQIRGTNRRLRECDVLLAKGHRTEAIQLAEQEPPLLDVIAILDFAELPEWNDFVAELGLTVAPELLIDIATDLNQAYSEDTPLEQHLRRFRLYSLARAPLRKRIATLKKIAGLDADNAVWESDLCSYEEVRVRQIKEEYQAAKQNQDMEKLQDLATELRGKWLIQPGEQVTSRVNQAIKSLKQSHALERLRQLTKNLESACNDVDLSLAVERSAEWESVAETCAENEELRELRSQARNALGWVQQQKELIAEEESFNKSVERLRRAIKQRQDLTELERRYAATRRHRGFELPGEIQEDYEEAVLDSHRRRKTRLIITAVSVGVGLIGVAILLLIWMAGS